MLVPRHLLVLAAAVLAVDSTPLAMAADDKLIGWFPCSSFTFKEQIPEPSNSTTNAKSLLANSENLEAQCAIFKAPLCYDGVCEDKKKQEIEIFAKRIVGESPDGKPNVIFMQGGPGAASPTMESAMSSLYESLSGKVNVYTLDHRGTGRSTKLDSKPDASVLLLSSKLDPQTPHKYAEYLYKALDTDKKELVTFEHATHGTIWTTPLSDDPGAKVCGMELLASYVKNGGDLSKLDKSCVAAMPPINLKLDETVMYKWLSTESAFDGKFDPKYAASVEESSANGGNGASSSSSTEAASSKSYKGGFIAFLVLFIVATLAAGVFLFKWRRTKRESASSNVQAYQGAGGEV
ncbi:hypothetical protein P43SY_006762 [Pythium insidiosum]|uniref:Peptidase S33 tripeptidyl aminopeptidase-like C-terminal domain-containing protein n=1 Tax=Pythium insidiosum TaxID=114742 RepID=A0AAD5LTR9_PYTIN|nr:hypothetical protein P43SY_006762 [Pythium insidiosum]